MEDGMHDLDRTQLEAEQDYFGEAYPAQEAAYEQRPNGEYEQYPNGEYEGGGPLDEVQEMEFAAELLEVTNEAELDQFLGKLFKGVTSAAGQFLRSDTGRALGGFLKDKAREALPALGHAVGERLAPGSGGDIGAQLASKAGQLFGLELEGLSGEDREFEASRQLVRYFADAAQEAAAAQASKGPVAAARTAATVAAQRHAPGLLAGAGAPGAANGGGRRTGRWVRRGRTIVLLGI
jgi:hypothetical protein